MQTQTKSVSPEQANNEAPIVIDAPIVTEPIVIDAIVTDAPIVIAVNKHKVVLGEFGNGRYSPAMNELFKDSQRLLGFTPEQAHVSAVRIGIDAGQLTTQKVNIAYGKSMSKDGKRTLKEVVKGMKVTNTWAMSIGFLCATLDDARQQGLIVNDCTVEKSILKFVNEAVERIEPVAKLEPVAEIEPVAKID